VAEAAAAAREPLQVEAHGDGTKIN
jgi:hypothetical protein